MNDLSGRYVSAGQSPEGGLWDLLFMAAHAARRHENRDTSEFVYSLIMPVGAGDNSRKRLRPDFLQLDNPQGSTDSQKLDAAISFRWPKVSADCFVGCTWFVLRRTSACRRSRKSKV